MATKRTIRTRNQYPEFTKAALFYASDGLWGDEDDLDLSSLDYRYPAVRPEECRAAWNALRDDVLIEWVKQHPGTRPLWWWLFDAPEPQRRRLGGIGDPSHEHLGIEQSYEYGIAEYWVTPYDFQLYNGRAVDIHGRKILDYQEGNFSGRAPDPNDPPQFESQPTYLARHGLLSPQEKRRLKPADFEPETVEGCNEQEETNGIET